MFEQHDGFFHISSVSGIATLENIKRTIEEEKIVCKEKTKYYNTIAAFDIETSKITVKKTKNKADDRKHKMAWMYIWQLGVNGYAVYGRTWGEFLDTVNMILEARKDKSANICIYVHNLAYEFQFMHKYFDFAKVFALHKRKPIYAQTTNGIEFRCSYIESGSSLEKVGENLTKYKISKMVGDLDYNKIRTPITPIDCKELKYAENDVRVIMSHIAEEIETWGDITKIPMTNTGRVRTYTREKCLKDSDYTLLMKKLQIAGTTTKWNIPDVTQYEAMQRAFRGGDVEASLRALKSEKPFKDVYSKDITSSYPTVMVSELFPMSRGNLSLNVKTTEDLEELEESGKLYICDIWFKGLIARRNEAFYLKSSHCYGDETKESTSKKFWLIENGGIIKAEVLGTTITSVDYQIIRENYVWEQAVVKTCWVYEPGYLPKTIIETTLKFYSDKTTLKGVIGKETEYQFMKGMLNSLYGMMVTSFDRPIVNYDYAEKCWLPDTPCDVVKAVADYNRSRARFLYYPWGVFITAYARRNLFAAIFSLGSDFLYCDTDSVKYTNREAHEEWFKKYNEQITEKINTVLDYYGIERELSHPKDIEGNIHQLGEFDDDGVYLRFKTLGAKRYMVEKEKKGKIIKEITVAGVPKSAINNIEEQAKKAGKDAFDMFRIGLRFEAGDISKLMIGYFDNAKSLTVTDYLGAKYEVREESFAVLEDAEYELTDDPTFSAFCELLRSGEYETELGAI